MGHLACFAAYAIFGFNIVVCKSLTSSHLLEPLTIYALRSLGAGAIFWLLSLFLPYERVAWSDLWKIAVAAFLGFFLTQLSFLMAIPDITPMDCSIMGSLSPIYTMFIAAIAVKEPITLKKAGGVLLSFLGILYLILTSINPQGGEVVTKPAGLLLMVVNSLSFALYLGIFRPLINRYSVVTFMKWIFFFAIVMVLPLTASDILAISWSEMPSSYLWQLSYLIIFATFIAYFLIPLGQKRIRPTLVSLYSYLQPIIAIAISIWIGMDRLTVAKVIAALTVVAGVAIVTRSRRAGSN